MGRHHIKLPDHLYISPPPPQPASAFALPALFFAPRSSSFDHSTSLPLYTASTTRAFERRIPGFKTSAAFLSALRANIDLQLDPPDSPLLTPESIHPLAYSHSPSISRLDPPTQAMSSSNVFSDADLAPPAALQRSRPSVSELEDNAQAQASRNPNEIPELITLPANDDATRIEALRLVADSVAQQRQLASRAIIFHPVTIGFFAIVIAVLRQYFYKGATSDYAIVGTTFAGILASVLVGIRAKTGPYIEEAERVGTWRWLAQGRGTGTEKTAGVQALGDHGDEILVTKFGDEYIGTIVYRGVQFIDDSPSKKSSKKSNSISRTRTEIRAWTVKRRYRGKGVGTALLEDAIKDAHERDWAQGGVEIAVDHANSKVVLPQLFGGFMRRNDEKARHFVGTKVREYEETNQSLSGKGKKRR